VNASLQLWSLRGPVFAEGLDSVVRKVAAAGWTRIEPFGLAATAAEVEPLVTELGLEVPTVHAELRTDDLEPVFDAAARLGAHTVLQHSFAPDSWGDRAAVAENAAVLQRAAKLAADRGMRVGWHHHDDDLADLDGRPALMTLFDLVEGDDLIGVQADVHWAALADVDAVQLLRQLGDRVLAVHVKDGPGRARTAGGANSDQVALGRGQLDVEGFLAALPVGTPVVVSHDAYEGEPFEAVEASRLWLWERGIR
jgi:sugar phosphate isomerase/epimerase